MRNPVEAQYLPQNTRILNFRNSSRPGSVTSTNGPPSPPAGNTFTPPLVEKTPGNLQNPREFSGNIGNFPGNPSNFAGNPQTFEFNNNKNHNYTNEVENVAAVTNIPQIGTAEGAYMNLIEPKSPTQSLNSEPYARLDLEVPVQDVHDHVYINVTLDEARNLTDLRKTSIQVRNFEFHFLFFFYFETKCKCDTSFHTSFVSETQI